ncbi:hypothetical protein [Siphonobacter sp. SORGH_AS_0500]|uniref:hypothetical protein n=1 Tax=Siphonobacter sp. SORGH_AS_0500 TaxID=1864824 RepID=UPI00286551B2|nr:hypothetical protein [Siphonobacter sp. SORGH_AS_0500]MDR6193080.1 hypothetical protein [Siphonobacter sp. SORGH_AS_0500]
MKTRLMTASLLFISKNIKPFGTLLFLTLTIASCTHKPDLQGFPIEKWKADKGGCTGERKTLLADFKKIRQNLKGTSSNDFVDIFGRPDINQIADRNQEYYVYFLEAGPHCEDITKKSEAASVAIRFSSVGLAAEITFQNGTPVQ